MGVIIVLDTIAEYGLYFGADIDYGVVFPIVGLAVGPLVALTFLLSFTESLKGKAHVANLYANLVYFGAAMIAMGIDGSLYMTKKEQFFCPAADPITGEVTGCSTS